ncbi:putative Calnexin like protein [Blattamonas nauphoetae]|uniref:Calnexin like protein n=1 Tax=Blattamonas nauphoetae TaxID=2049346 RepID=A0ABQ9YC68_9EUKA|nr:putative Calnexin like protein [Blattamonas nauphoetae]
MLIFLSIILESHSKIYFSEEFHEGWRSRWVQSQSHIADGEFGKIGWHPGKFYGHFEENMGMVLLNDKSRYDISADIGETISNKNSDLIISYTVKFEQGIDCGGGYIKIFPDTLNQVDLNENSTYCIMFGPDVYLHWKREVQFFIVHNGKILPYKRKLPMIYDRRTHMYTLILHPNNTYEIRIDNDLYRAGCLAEDFEFIDRHYVVDEDATKPDDWDDRMEIPDPTDEKPEDWDDREFIPDPDAKKPADWDDSKGTWEPPLISNPSYAGEYFHLMLPNPNYMGPWKRPMKEHDLWKEKDTLYCFENIRYVAVDVWQVKAGTIFDNFFIGDNLEEFEEFQQRTFQQYREKEEEMFAKIREEEHDLVQRHVSMNHWTVRRGKDDRGHWHDPDNPDDYDEEPENDDDDDEEDDDL